MGNSGYILTGHWGRKQPLAPYPFTFHLVGEWLSFILCVSMINSALGDIVVVKKNLPHISNAESPVILWQGSHWGPYYVSVCTQDSLCSLTVVCHAGGLGRPHRMKQQRSHSKHLLSCPSCPRGKGEWHLAHASSLVVQPLQNGVGRAAAMPGGMGSQHQGQRVTTWAGWGLGCVCLFSLKYRNPCCMHTVSLMLISIF